MLVFEEALCLTYTKKRDEPFKGLFDRVVLPLSVNCFHIVVCGYSLPYSYYRSFTMEIT